MDISLSHPIAFKKVMYVRNCAVGTFACVHNLVYQVTYLSRYGFSTHSEYATFTSGLEMHWAWLVGIRWVMELLGIIVTVVHFTGDRIKYACSSLFVPLKVITM